MIERFLKYVSFTTGNGCWIWKGYRSRYGYGGFSSPETAQAHRFSYSIFIGRIPPGMFVCHHCDNPPCVRPDHLFIGTPKDNIDDMMRKGRNMHKVCPETLARGDRNGTRTKPETVRKGEKIEWHKLFDKDVIEIRRAYYEDGITARELASKFQVIKQTIDKIVANHTWKHVPNPYNSNRPTRKRPSSPAKPRGKWSESYTRPPIKIP